MKAPKNRHQEGPEVKPDTRILPVALRPRTLSAMVGQDKLAAAIRKQIAKRPPSAFLFYGGTGTGKTTMARILALAFQCQHQKLWGDPCPTCWRHWPEFAIHEINASEVSGVEEIGKVAGFAQHRPMLPSQRRVVILDEAQLLTNNAQNLLLKHFEEAAPETVWIVCTTVPGKILATLRRRCVTYQLKALGFEDREKLLRNAAKVSGITRNLRPLLERVNERQVASPALLLMALEKYESGLSTDEAVATVDGTGIDTLRICKAVTAGEWQKLRGFLDGVSTEDTRWVRAAVSGWLRGCLRQGSDPKRHKAEVDGIVLLTEAAPLEDTLLLHWLWARLYQICSRFAGL